MRWFPSNSSSFNSMLFIDMRETRKTVDGGPTCSTEVLSSLDGAFSLNGRHFLRRRWRRQRDHGYVAPMRPRQRGAGGGGHSGSHGPRGRCLRSTGSAPRRGGALSLLVLISSSPPTSPSGRHERRMLCLHPWGPWGSRRLRGRMRVRVCIVARSARSCGPAPTR